MLAQTITIDVPPPTLIAIVAVGLMVVMSAIAHRLMPDVRVPLFNGSAIDPRGPTWLAVAIGPVFFALVFALVLSVGNGVGVIWFLPVVPVSIVIHATRLVRLVRTARRLRDSR